MPKATPIGRFGRIQLRWPIGWSMTAICAHRAAGVGRVETWRGDVRLSMSVPAPFVWRCLSVSAVAPFSHPLIEPDMQISRIRLSDKTSRRLSRATPLAASEHHLELLGCPISMSRPASCVCLELRSLPSTRVTRFPRYYEPLRHPMSAQPVPHGRPVGPVLPDLTTVWGC